MPAISECCVGNAQFFCTRVSKKSDCLFLCQPHLLITMMIEGKFDCILKMRKISNLMLCKNIIVEAV